jgi:hypothetical protein
MVGGFPSLYLFKEQTLEYDTGTTFIYINKSEKDRKILNTHIKLSYLQNIGVLIGNLSVT